MSEVTRRSFLVGSGIGALGVAGVAAAGGLPGIAEAASAQHHVRDEELAAAAAKPMVLHVRDARRGEVGILVDEREVVVKDRALVAKLLRATR